MQLWQKTCACPSLRIDLLAVSALIECRISHKTVQYRRSYSCSQTTRCTSIFATTLDYSNSRTPYMMPARISLVNSLLKCNGYRERTRATHVSLARTPLRDLGDNSMKIYQLCRALSHGLMPVYAKDSSPEKVTRREQGFERITTRLYPFFRAALAIQNAHHFCNRAAKLLNCSYS